MDGVAGNPASVARGQERERYWIGKLISLMCGSKVDVSRIKIRRFYAI
jgi:hypothetical protein